MKLMEAIRGLGQFLKAMGVTLRYFFSRPITVQYPDEPVRLYPRFRGRHQLNRYEEGPYVNLEKCVGCALCAAYCPTGCIYVEAAENTDQDRHSPGERYARIYEINILRCMFCGFCAEACPTGAITMGHEFALADYGRERLIYDKDHLLKPAHPNAVILEE